MRNNIIDLETTYQTIYQLKQVMKEFRQIDFDKNIANCYKCLEGAEFYLEKVEKRKAKTVIIKQFYKPWKIRF